MARAERLKVICTGKKFVVDLILSMEHASSRKFKSDNEFVFLWMKTG